MKKRFFVVGHKGVGGGAIVLRTLYGNLKKLGCEVNVVDDDELENVPYILISPKFKAKLLVYNIVGKKLLEKSLEIRNI